MQMPPKCGGKEKERLQGHLEGNSEQNPASQVTSWRCGLYTEFMENGYQCNKQMLGGMDS